MHLDSIRDGVLRRSDVVAFMFEFEDVEYGHAEWFATFNLNII